MTVIGQKVVCVFLQLQSLQRVISTPLVATEFPLTYIELLFLQLRRPGGWLDAHVKAWASIFLPCSERETSGGTSGGQLQGPSILGVEKISITWKGSKLVLNFEYAQRHTVASIQDVSFRMLSLGSHNVLSLYFLLCIYYLSQFQNWLKISLFTSENETFLIKYPPAATTGPSFPICSPSQIRSIINHIILENQTDPGSFTELFLEKYPGEGRVDKLNTVLAKAFYLSQ